MCVFACLCVRVYVKDRGREGRVGPPWPCTAAAPSTASLSTFSPASWLPAMPGMSFPYRASILSCQTRTPTRIRRLDCNHSACTLRLSQALLDEPSPPPLQPSSPPALPHSSATRYPLLDAGPRLAGPHSHLPYLTHALPCLFFIFWSFWEGRRLSCRLRALAFCLRQGRRLVP